MDTQTLTNALRSLDTEAMTWSFALYNILKTGDGPQLDWNLCKMRGVAVHAGRIAEYLLKKPVADKPVAPYSPFLSDKENIGVLAHDDEVIREQTAEIVMSIQKGQAYAPEDYVSGLLPKTAGYAFYGERLDEGGQVIEKVLFMKRGNPFLTGGASALLIAQGEEIVGCDTPILKLGVQADFVMIGEACYFLSAAIEKDFALENRHFAIAQKRMAAIAEAGIVSDYDRLEATAMASKHVRKFTDFDKGILEHIAALPIPEREEFLTTYGVTIDVSGHIDTSDAEQCELVIDLLCCRSCLDPLGRLSVGSNITPRE